MSYCKSFPVLIFLILGLIRLAQAAEDLPVEFHYSPDREIQEVFVAGSFNNWDAKALRMERTGLTWSSSTTLPIGWYYYKFVVDGEWIADPSNPEVAPDGNSVLKVGEPHPMRKSRGVPFDPTLVPRPVLSDTGLVNLYYAAWAMAWQKISSGTPENGFVNSYLDEGFNELIYQWDSCFMSAFSVYSPRAFPGMGSLDNFYSKQRDDGYIQRVYWESDGREAAEPTADEPLINPPLFACMEWRYYQITGDSTRLTRVLPHLTHYYEWIDANCASPSVDGLYYNTPLGSGMDNTPRPDCEQGGWVDMSCQQALAARCIANMLEFEGDRAQANKFRERANVIATVVNKKCWDPERKFYFDVNKSGGRSSVMHVGGFWPLVAEIADQQQIDACVNWLQDTSTFNRPHRVPTLAANQNEYDSTGHYWLGSVWAPTNFMVVKGLEAVEENDLADEVALNHVSNMLEVYEHFTPDESHIAYEERYGDGYKTIWECYSPERMLPATRWDGIFYSRQDFVGWSGLGPSALLIENVLGLTIDGANNTIDWHIARTDVHGIEHLRFRDQDVSLICTPKVEGLSIQVQCENPFILRITPRSGETNHYDIAPGVSNYLINY